MMRTTLLSVCLFACTAPSDDDTPPPASHPLPGVVPGGLVERGAVAAIAPAPGEAVFAEALLDDGTTLTLHLRTELDGTVLELVDHHEHITTFAANGCGTDAHVLAGHRWNTRYDWHFHAGSTPPSLDADAVLASLRSATRNITDARNACGLADRVSFTALYQGTTTRAPNTNANNTCAQRDGVNVTGFGDLLAGTLAIACTWSNSAGIAQEGDVRMNKQDHAWYTTLPASCTNRFSIEAVITHERGHTAGLGHTTVTGQTMFPTIQPCTDAFASLGSGDVAGLRRLY